LNSAAGTWRTVTAERVVTSAGGFNPTWQRHVAAYRLCEPLLPGGRVLDLGCGTGHSYRLLAPRESVGVDINREALEGQERETHVADMRDLPFAAASFASVLAVQSLEHVPDPERVVAEVVRVLEPAGVAAFVTPNRLTFGPPEEIIDPYHYVEYDAEELRGLLAPSFRDAELQGVFGSEAYLAIQRRERRQLNALLRRDPLRLRQLVPRRVRQRLYDWRLSRARLGEDPVASAIGSGDFELREGELRDALDLVAVCHL
jgi:SAM-dependent methyltransferase